MTGKFQPAPDRTAIATSTISASLMHDDPALVAEIKHKSMAVSGSFQEMVAEALYNRQQPGGSEEALIEAINTAFKQHDMWCAECNQCSLICHCARHAAGT